MSTSCLTIGFSTLERNFELFAQRLKRMAQIVEKAGGLGKIDILVVIQGAQFNGSSEQDGIRFVHSTTYGLSRSRNIVIDESKSEYVWFLDDDVFFSESQIVYLLESIAFSTQDIVLGQIRCSDAQGLYKNYNKRSRSAFWMLKCSSIEIIVKRSFVNLEKIRFNTEIGLGTKFPSGEENIFLLDCSEKNASKLFLENDIVSHPCLDVTRNDFRNKTLRERMYVQGFITKRLGLFKGFLVFAFWSFKFSLRYASIKVPFWMAKGWFLKF